MPGAQPSTDVITRPPTLEFTSVDLQVFDGPDRGTTLTLEPGSTRIGTAPSCPLRLTDRTVSRVHCDVRVERGGVRVVDAGSTNGTHVDGVRIFDAALSSGCTLRIGATAIRVTFGEEPLRVMLSTRDRFGAVLGASAEMRRVYAFMERMAPTDATVLIQGESGTGKEVVARAIHDASRRSKGAFVAVDCGAIADNLVESELFGHVRGAFSGAFTDRRGLFEEAQAGTVFLDEIGELPTPLQPKLLRVLEMREVRRVGSNTPLKIDVRVIAATNRPLAQSVNAGTFREDLYYRLAVLELALPPLRARPEDVPLLANEFYARVTGTSEKLPARILESLAMRSWPGNVRELKNFIERSAALGWSSSTRDDAPSGDWLPPAAILDGLVPADLPFREARDRWNEQFETLYVTALLKRTGGNVSRAAGQAGINRRYLHKLMAEHHIRGAGGEGEEDDGDR